MAILIIGGDSRLSRVLMPLLERHNETIYATTRRVGCRQMNGVRTLFLDLAQTDAFVIPADVERMAIIGGVVDYKECEDRYDFVSRINNVNLPNLARRLLERGGYVCFVSTNTVFKFNGRLPTEDDIRCPGFPYAQLKAQAEEALENVAAELGCSDRLSILRLTKNVGAETSPFNMWITSLAIGQAITPFSDLYFAPVRFEDSAHALDILLQSKKEGVFHLSGERDIDYASFGNGLCRHLGLPSSLVTSVCSTDVGVSLTYNHSITGLAMPRTYEKLGLTPVPLMVIYDFLGRLLERYKPR